MRELSLYFHIPYCKSKCYYCDFNSYADKKHTVSKYFDSLVKEIEMHEELKGAKVKSIFFGGGSPSIVQADHIIKIMNKCKSFFKIAPNAEISIEGNPESLTKQKLKKYKEIGINRVSIGLQAWQNNILKDIGRIHTREQFINAYKAARKVGFNNINIDLIFGLPNQTMEDWIETLDNVVELKPEHISCYSLKLEEGTALYEKNEKNLLTLPDEDVEREMYYAAKAILEKNGHKQYEISNFAKPKFECFHNTSYWTYREYVGFGAGSHSFFDLHRAENESNIERYISNISSGHFAYETRQEIDHDEQISEYIITRLRMSKGISKNEFKKKFGLKIEDRFNHVINKFINDGLLHEDKQYIKLTEKGLDFGNVVMREFI